MARKSPIFLDLLVALDASDGIAGVLTPKQYRDTAARVRSVIWDSFRKTPMHKFVGHTHAMQTIAANIYFDERGYLPNVDGRSDPVNAKLLCDAAIAHAQRPAQA